MSTLRFLEAHAVPSEPVHGVGSNLDLIEANDTLRLPNAGVWAYFAAVTIRGHSAFSPGRSVCSGRGRSGVAAISFSRVELRSSSSVSASRIEACSRPCLTAAMRF